MKSNGILRAINKTWIRPMALLILLNILAEIFWPIKAFALTGGPSQPEVESFEPVGTTDMVDLFSGDFNYNIPLFDVGGYPVNLSYHAGIGMDQEASWVGLGWNINPGVINRTTRGIPDDFNGDLIVREVNMKSNRTIGFNAGLDLEIFGKSGNNKVTDAVTMEKWNRKQHNRGKFQFGFGVILNNYKGVGYSMNLSYDISKTEEKPNSNQPEGKNFTFDDKPLSGKIGLSANSQNGSDWNFSASYSWNRKSGRKNSTNIGLGYNSFGGINDFSVGYSSSKCKQKKSDKQVNTGYGAHSSVPIGTSTYTPAQNLGFRTQSISFNATIGFEAFGGHPDIRVGGFWNREELLTKTINNRAFGYLYEHNSERTRGGYRMVLDFNREKEGEYNKYRTHLPLTNPTYDIYSVQGQGIGGMYRPFHTTLGVYNDPKVESQPGIKLLPSQGEIGMELGFGANFHWGVNGITKGQYRVSGLWSKGNEKFLNKFNRPAIEEGLAGHVYFKAAGEFTQSDNDFINNWGGENPTKLDIKKSKVRKRGGQNFAHINESGGNTTLPVGISDQKRPIRANSISFLTASEASATGIGLDPNIISYDADYWESNSESRANHLTEISRTGNQGRQAHHISEVSSTSPDGTRYVYGIPAYNTIQMDASFAISPDFVAGDNSKRNTFQNKGLVEYKPGEDDSIGNARGANHYFEKTTTPGYAHSYLLTGVLSADYVDVTGDGITDDDLGSAVKFNYNRTSANYKWRNPYGQNMAMLDQGYLADPTDDNATYSYGEKEIWHLHSIVSRTHIAEFRISPRTDGRGVANKNGGLSTADNNKSYKLDSIIVYSKWDRLKNGKNATPVKIIVFQYDYSLCPGVPNNSSSNGGKLTLKAVYFTYGNSNKGALTPYRFTYSNFNPGYDQTKYDRWGNYKDPSGGIENKFYPYVDQEKDSAFHAQNASAWNLTKIDLPSGGKIKVTYESDDYAYVQNKRAMQMIKIVGSTYNLPGPKEPLTNELYDKSRDHKYLVFKSNVSYDGPMGNKAAMRKFVIDNYLKDENNNLVSLLAYRFRVNMNPASRNDNWEYISGYLQLGKELDWSSLMDDFTRKHEKSIKQLFDQWQKSEIVCGLYKKDGTTYCYVKTELVKQGDVGLTSAPRISKRAWQIGLRDLRKVLYPGSDRQMTDDNGNKEKAIRGLAGAMATALNIFTGPYQNLRWKGIASKFQKDSSFLRVYNPINKKYGGGCRVKQLVIDDQWNEMGGSQETGIYGQVFDYTTVENIGGINKRISSGVAQYEPMLGNDENPCRMPVFYTENRPGATDIEDYYEEPFGESFYPGPSVGYSKITVKNIPKQGAKASSTGKTVHLFYTARDFPITTNYTNLNENGDGNNSLKRSASFLKNLISPVKREAAAATQGYVIKLNDMHGKPKGVKIYSELGKSAENPDGELISGTEYRYKIDANTPEINNPFPPIGDKFKAIPKNSKLSSKVWIMNQAGQLLEKEIGKEMDVAIDLRASFSKYEHYGLDYNNDQFFVATFPMPWPKYLVNENLYQSAGVTKIFQQYGILEETIAYDQSSVVRTKNLVWDEQSGQVLLAATTNEFDDPIYNFNYPAYWAYSGMGPSYKNLDRQSNLNLGSNGKGKAASNEYFVPGDELLMQQGNNMSKGWVLKTWGDSVQVIDRMGLGITGFWQVKVIRSGRKNHLNANVGQIVSMNNDIYSSGTLVLDQKIVQSSAVIFSDDWPGYINKAYQVYMKCDTINQELIDFHRLFKHIVENTQQENYVYNDYQKNTYDLSPLSWFAGSTLGKRVKNSCNPSSFYCDSGYNAEDIRFSFAFDSSNFYYDGSFGKYVIGTKLGRQYKCGEDTTWHYCTFSCPMSLVFDSSDCHFNLANIDSVSSDYHIFKHNYGTGNMYHIVFKVYDGASFCWLRFETDCNTPTINCYYLTKCDYVLGEYLNPYTNGLRGTWRQKEGFAFQGTRKYLYARDTTDIRHDGLIVNYSPFWKFRSDNKGIYKDTSGEAIKWVSTGKTTIITPEGNGVEEQDALGIYSSQLFGYNQTLVTAVASNARYQQIAFDNFEDYIYPYYQCNREDHWNFKKDLTFTTSARKVPNSLAISSEVLVDNYPVDGSGSAGLDNLLSHSGSYSLRVNAGANHSVLRQIDFSSTSIDSSHPQLYHFSDINRAIKPFAPIQGKYVLGGWVHEQNADPNSANTFANAYVNVKVYHGGSVASKDIYGSGVIINGWQRMEGLFDVPSGSDSIKVTLVNSGGVAANFDDIRIHTYNGNMKSFVYHPVLLKVMAELDENNYATFYEYDPEGNLVRVKKETEKGIVTVQESRKSIRRANP